MSEGEKDEILALWRGRQHSRTAAREQSEIREQDGRRGEVPKQKLQIAASSDCEPTNNVDAKESKVQEKNKEKPNADENIDYQVLAMDDMNMDIYHLANFNTWPSTTRPFLKSSIPRLRTPVTPQNARSWARKRKGSRFHCWEWCSGSGRLSFIAPCAGLAVMFPLDYRYGWDLGCQAHRKLINEIDELFQPDVEYMSSIVVAPRFASFPPSSSGAEWGSQFFQETVFVPSIFFGSGYGSGVCLPILSEFCSIIISCFLLVPTRIPGLVSLVFWHSVPSSCLGSFWFRVRFRGLSTYFFSFLRNGAPNEFFIAHKRRGNLVCCCLGSMLVYFFFVKNVGIFLFEKHFFTSCKTG